MIEYLYDAIRAVAGQDIEVEAILTDANEQAYTEDCCFVLHVNEDMYKAQGEFQADTQTWLFVIPADVTANIPKGRYEYCIQHNDENMCFMEPIYLV